MFANDQNHALLELYEDSPARYKILLVFVSHPFDSFNLRETAHEADIGTSTIHRHKDFIQYLLDTGLLTQQETEAGVTEYQLDRESEFAQTAVEWYRMNEEARKFYETESEADSTMKFYE